MRYWGTIILLILLHVGSTYSYASDSSRKTLINVYDGLIKLDYDSIWTLSNYLLENSEDQYALALSNYYVAYIKNLDNDLRAASHYIKAIHQLEKADTSDIFLEMSLRKNLGVIFKQYGDFESGIRYYLEALPFAEAYDKTRPFKKQTYVMSLKYNLANAYGKNYNPKAIDIYLEILEEAKKKEINLKIAQINNSLGILFEEANEYDLAIKHYKNVLKTSDALPNPKLRQYIGYANQNLGETYHSLGKYELAEEYLLTSLEYLDNKKQFGPLVVLVELYLDQNLKNQAKVFGDRALNIYPSVQKSEEKLKIFELMASLSSTEGERANIYLSRLLKEQKALNQDLTTLTNLKDKENLYRVVDSYYRELEANQRRSEYRQWIVTGCAILVALIALVALYFMIMDKRKKQQLSDIGEDGSSDFKYY